MRRIRCKPHLLERRHLDRLQLQQLHVLLPVDPHAHWFRDRRPGYPTIIPTYPSVLLSFDCSLRSLAFLQRLQHPPRLEEGG